MARWLVYTRSSSEIGTNLQLFNIFATVLWVIIVSDHPLLFYHVVAYDKTSFSCDHSSETVFSCVLLARVSPVRVLPVHVLLVRVLQVQSSPGQLSRRNTECRLLAAWPIWLDLCSLNKILIANTFKSEETVCCYKTVKNNFIKTSLL